MSVRWRRLTDKLAVDDLVYRRAADTVLVKPSGHETSLEIAVGARDLFVPVRHFRAVAVRPRFLVTERIYVARS